MMQRGTFAALRTKWTSINVQFAGSLTFQTESFAGGIARIIVRCLRGVRGGVVAPGFFLSVEYHELVLPGIIAVINMQVIDSFSHIFDFIRSDRMSARIAALFAHANGQHVMILAVILHRTDKSLVNSLLSSYAP